jgi:hypothetical protein
MIKKKKKRKKKKEKRGLRALIYINHIIYNLKRSPNCINPGNWPECKSCNELEFQRCNKNLVVAYGLTERENVMSYKNVKIFTQGL